jgi:hypothetical protein
MLSITTVNRIKLPPQKVSIVGISCRKKKANIIPKTGCKLLIILAVGAEKNFKECSIKLWPMAVVKNASKSR